MTKYTATIRMDLIVEFEDDEEMSLSDQAMEIALNGLSNDGIELAFAEVVKGSIEEVEE
jgi:hypothetical protein